MDFYKRVWVLHVLKDDIWYAKSANKIVFMSKKDVSEWIDRVFEARGMIDVVNCYDDDSSKEE